MTSTGIGLRDKLDTVIKQPNIFALMPDVIYVGETDEIEIWGSQLTPDGEEPVITIADSPVPVKAISPDRIVLDVSSVVTASASAVNPVDLLADATNLIMGRDLASDLGLVSAMPVDKTLREGTPGLENLFDLVPIDPGGIVKKIPQGPQLPGGGSTGGSTSGDNSGGGLELPGGSSTLKLDYANFNDITTVVRVVSPPPPTQPADLRISRLVVTPAGLVANQNATASVTIRNDGGTAANNFLLRWKPTATHPGLTTSVPSLAAGASQTFTFNHSYVNPGSFDTVATVDVLNTVPESNEGNNDSLLHVTVAEQPPRQARVTVQFTGVTVDDDADPWPKGDGEYWFDFDVNGNTGRFPNSGTSSIGSGSTKAFTRTFTLTVAEGDTLAVFVNGKELDDDSSDDQMGTINKTYHSSQNWGSGTHNDKSTCPDGCYTMHYTISFTWLN